MKTKFTLLIGLLLSSIIADAAPVRRLYQDVKLPTQQVIEKQTVTAPAATSTTNVLSANAGPTSASTVTITSGITNPDAPRNLVITPGATTASVAACTITVTGTNIFNATITETFAFLDNASSATTGAKAFKTVSSIAFPASCEDSPYDATWSVGAGSKLGLNRCMAKASDFLVAALAGVREGTFATIVADTDEVEKNTAALSSSLNGTDVQLYFMQNFGCFP